MHHLLIGIIGKYDNRKTHSFKYIKQSGPRKSLVSVTEPLQLEANEKKEQSVRWLVFSTNIYIHTQVDLTIAH